MHKYAGGSHVFGNFWVPMVNFEGGTSGNNQGLTLMDERLANFLCQWRCAGSVWRSLAFSPNSTAFTLSQLKASSIAHNKETIRRTLEARWACYRATPLMAKNELFGRSGRLKTEGNSSMCMEEVTIP